MNYKSKIIIHLSVFVVIACSSGVVKKYNIDQVLTLSSIAENGSSSKFNTLLLASEPLQKKTGVVLLHGRGGHPNTAVVRQLRNDLFHRGYVTLSIQEPVPAGYEEGSGEKPPFQEYIDDIDAGNNVFPELYARVRSALNYLQRRGVRRVVLIGFSMGSRMAVAHLANGRINEIPIVGLIGVGMYANSIVPLNVGLMIRHVDVPVLDIYGDADTHAATTALFRKESYEKSGAGPNIAQHVLVCGLSLTTNACHKLVGLKGTSDARLETIVAA